jgi:hypothetical protein
MDNHSMEQPNRICQEFARILGATPNVINGVCTATNSRTNIRPVVLGRQAESFMFVPQAYTFENVESDGRALCLGETVILEKEINSFVSRLRKHGIIVTAIHNHWLFDKPRLMYIHFESIDEPLSFARKVRDANRVLTNEIVSGGAPMTKTRASDRLAEKLCEQFHDILGGMHTFENGVCTVMQPRNGLRPTILGNRTRSFIAIPQMFSFESLTPDGKALCTGETVILQEEINPFISMLRKHNIIVTALHNHYLFEKPRLMFIHFAKIENPVRFAEQTKDALDVLSKRK